MRFVTPALAALLAVGAIQICAAETYDQVSRAFLQRPEQQKDIQTALKAKAGRLPGLCAGIQFTPTDLFVKPPAPTFDPSGQLIEGALRQSYSSSGCGSFKPIFNVWVIAAPGLPLRTITTAPGTTRTFIDLQEKAIATLAEPARKAVPGCSELTVVDTKMKGFDTPADDPAGSFREDWLVGGCGKLAVVPLHFVPEKAQQNTLVEITGPVVPAEMR